VQAIEQFSHQALRRFAFDRVSLADGQCSRIGIEKCSAQGPRLVVAQRQALAAEPYAGEEANQIPAGGCQDRFVEVVDVEVRQAEEEREECLLS
jgi:hypothetical protein